MFQTSADVTRIFVRTHMRAGKDGGRTVEALDPQVLGVLALSSGLGLAMFWLGIRFNALEQRHWGRCPACGVLRRGGSCSCSE
jgi:hypothetical protein